MVVLGEEKGREILKERPFFINNDLNVKTLVPILFVIPNLFRDLTVVEWGLDKRREEYYFDEKDLGL